MSSSIPAQVRRTGTDSIEDGHVPVWDEASNSFKDGGELEEGSFLNNAVAFEQFQVTAADGALTFAPPSPLPAIIFREAALTVKVRDVSDSNKIKPRVPTEINPSTGAVTLANADVDDGDVVYVTWLGIID